VLLRAAEITDTYLLVNARGNCHSKEASDEQGAIISHGIDDKPTSSCWEEWRKLLPGTAFTFHPSMKADKLVKADKK
jgi:hypothetical protein